MKKIAGILVFVLMTISGCGLSKDGVGVWASLTGRFKGDIVVGVVGTMWIMEDCHYLDGVRLAAEEINASGGIDRRSIKLRELDDGAQTMEGIRIAQELTENPEVLAVIGHWDSHVTLPAASIYENAGLPMITATATTPKLTQKGYKHIFRNVPSDEIMGGEMAVFAGQQGLKRLAIYYSDTDYGRGLANSFEKMAREQGVRIVDRITNFIDEDDFLRAMERWKAFNCDGVFIADSMPDAGSVIKRIKAVYPEIPVMGTDGLDSPDFVETLGEAAEGTVIATLFNPGDDNPELAKFIDSFRRRYNEEPDVYAVQGYETFKLLCKAMESAGRLAPAEVTEALRAIKQWPGLTGILNVEANGDVKGKTIHKKVVRGGEYAYLPIQ